MVADATIRPDAARSPLPCIPASQHLTGLWPTVFSCCMVTAAATFATVSSAPAAHGRALAITIITTATTTRRVRSVVFA